PTSRHRRSSVWPRQCKATASPCSQVSAFNSTAKLQKQRSKMRRMLSPRP
ncbi:hypothetical protein AK812_SmicGene48094, partial [Symbiodinium microadriaticum]